MMMDWRLQLFLALCCLLFFVLCVHLLRKGIMEVKYALLWLAGSILMGLVVLFPEGLFALAKLVGIIDPTNMVFFLAFFLSLMIIFSLSIIVSKLSFQLRRLVQTVAILEKKVRDSDAGLDGFPADGNTAMKD